MRIAVVTGNPKPASRTHGVALAVAGALSGALRAPGAPGLAAPGAPGLAAPNAPGPGAHLAVDLAEHASSLFDPADRELSRLTAEVAAADIVVVASPTYKAAYTGMLKAFLDRYGGDGLAEPDAAVARWATTAIPLIRGALAAHEASDACPPLGQVDAGQGGSPRRSP
jgi:FMN reductase